MPAVDEILSLAHEFETDLLNERGIETIWFKNFKHMGVFASEIGKNNKKRGKKT